MPLAPGQNKAPSITNAYFSSFTSVSVILSVLSPSPQRPQLPSVTRGVSDPFQTPAPSPPDPPPAGASA
ncbi:hypothetical protein E2C01_083313 [Portunus trituberculatus]|uniref:Uncharacterized protein n=1 Tax=Portunus trituberculatus TaxID=210409 RepID=A0A5B7IS44_PORTR|nr:hypothetical protein [Portunus trituberculatus]